MSAEELSELIRREAEAADKAEIVEDDHAPLPEGTQVTRGLGATCACGHLACYHLTETQQAAYQAATSGRYQGECKGGVHAHCRCITSREEVQENALIEEAES